MMTIRNFLIFVFFLNDDEIIHDDDRNHENCYCELTRSVILSTSCDK